VVDGAVEGGCYTEKSVSKAAVFGVLGLCVAGGGIVGQEKISRVRLITQKNPKAEDSKLCPCLFHGRCYQCP
jgi:hypothetical protein